MYHKYVTLTQKIADIENSISVLHWDMETYMPEGGATVRARQISTLASIKHEIKTSEEYGNLLKNLKNDASLNPIQKQNIEVSLRDYTHSQKLPASFVEDLSQASSKGFVLWQKANKANDFTIFQDQLEVLVDLRKQEAELIGYEGHIYNALLDHYEPFMTVAELDILFSGVKKELAPLLKEIQNKGKVDSSFLNEKFELDKQWEFSEELLKQMGYDFKHGRLDKSMHPFSTSFGSEDVRLTTRIDEREVADMILSCVHEGGHGLYAQGVTGNSYGLPEGSNNSLGMDESISRFWENNIALSKEYWRGNYPKMQKMFPSQLQHISLEQFYAGMNKVEPSLIRTKADEITYHFHVMIRYEIEKGLMSGDIKVKDLPEVWNAYYLDYLGMEIPNNKLGVLQDVHWASGSIGYFPTYSLGSFYAATWHHFIKEDFPDFKERVERGELGFIKDWQRENIFKHGRILTAKEICTKISGAPLDFKYFMDYARKKYL